MTGQRSGVRYAPYAPLMLLLFAGASSAYETALLGLDLVEDRTAEMIESIKADMSINFVEAALLHAVVPGGGGGGDGDRSSGDEAMRADMVFPSYSLTNVDGVVHTCTVREEPENKAKSSRKKSTNTNTDISGALDPLVEGCATWPGHVWSYMWCHRQETIQFRTEKESTTSISLGKYTRTEVRRANAAPSNSDSADSAHKAAASDSSPANRGTGADAGKEEMEELNSELSEMVKATLEIQEDLEEFKKERPSWMSRVLKKAKGGSGKSNSDDPFQGIYDLSEVVAVNDFYEGGDICDETGERRSAKTTITCCSTDVVGADGQESPLALLVSVQELSVCSYLVQVCSRLLCPVVKDNMTDTRGDEARNSKEVAVTVGHRPDGVMGILQGLEACFPPKRESWWSYKLCLSTGISQFHEMRKGEAVGTTKDEFSLGKWDKSTVKGDGEHLIRPREEGAEGEGGTIVLEFTGGTECDLTGILRSSTVNLKCGPVQEVRDVTEDRTCHYRILAYSPLLCSHAALIPIKAAIRTVDCVAEGTNTRGEPKTKRIGA